MKHIVALTREFLLDAFCLPEEILNISCCISRDFSRELDWSVLVAVMQVSLLRTSQR